MSAKFLVIVESPSKISLIEKYLGQDYRVIASRGHICNIDSLKDIDVKGGFEPKYKIMKNKKDIVSSMRLVIDKYNYEEIYLGTDDDVEGEKIAFDICCVFKLPTEKMKRIVFNEITEIALIESIKAPKCINLNVVKSQQARQILDLLIGFKISPILWKYIHHPNSKTLSAGRCQSSALSLIYDNEKLCNLNHINKNYSTTFSFFEHPFTVEAVLSEKFVDESEVRDFLELSKTYPHSVSLSKIYPTSRPPPLPLNTSSMIQISSDKHNNSASITMKLAQQLYQDGMITYIRTESKKYSKEFLSKAELFITVKYGKEFVGNNDIISNIESKFPHEAIRVTNLKTLKVNGCHKVNELYSLIYKNTLESCMSLALFSSYDISVSAPIGLYSKQVDVRQFDGWLRFQSITKEEPDYRAYIKSLVVKSLKHFEIKCKLTVTNNNIHYTEVGLIKKLEELGIGRPSTYTSFIDVNLDCGYVKKQNIDGFKLDCIDFRLKDLLIVENKVEKTFCSEKNKLVIQERGVICVEFLRKYYIGIFDYLFTKRIEEALERIKDDSLNWSDICREINESIEVSSKNVHHKEGSHILDGSNTLKYLRYGPVIEHVDELNGKIEYVSINPNIVIDNKKLERNEYSVKDLTGHSITLGVHNNKSIILMNGKYGPYFRHDSINYKVKCMTMNVDDAIQIIEKNIKPSSIVSNKLLRVIDNNISIMNGKDNKPYIYYKPNNIPKPLFFNMKNINILSCEASEIITFVANSILHK
jgi:DNA topoisomerase-1